MAEKKIKITLVRSADCQVKNDQTKTAHALGLRKIGDSVVQPDNSSIQGMVFKIKHLVSVESA